MTWQKYDFGGGISSKKQIFEDKSLFSLISSNVI